MSKVLSILLQFRYLRQQNNQLRQQLRQLSLKNILHLMAVKCGKVLGACVSHPEIVTRAAPTNLAVPTI